MRAASTLRRFADRIVFALCAGLGAWSGAHAAARAPVIHHELHTRIDPATHRLEVRDRLHIPAALVGPDLRLRLNADLSLQDEPGTLPLVRVEARTSAGDVGIDRDAQGPGTHAAVSIYRIDAARPGRDLVGELVYGGVVDSPIERIGTPYARGFSQSSGLIEPRGVYLAGSTFWVPQVEGTMLTYTLDVALPAGWKSVSQGERALSAATDGKAHERWTVATPTEEVHLVAAPFTEYTRTAGAVQAMAFLRTPDPALAKRYLEVTAQYLEMYNGLLGAYPYAKFALVENFWETGYGMPSFTLLGEQVIRLPFILHSSYPHELLHNWWGNGVYVDFAGGNWCEGLTAYLADHLVAEQRGQGAEHRRAILQRVTDYVTPENDFPLTRFVGRYNPATEAIGYGKTAMIWNMLREQVGDEIFVAALRAFYREQRFRAAGFSDIRSSFEAASGRDLKPFFAQWVDHAGTPELVLEGVQASGKQLDITLAQVQRGRRFDLEVPLAIQTSTGVLLRKITLSADSTRVQQRFALDAPPLRVEVDPQFQVYRRLSPLETPPALSNALGASRVLIVTPAGGEALYAGLVQAWRADGVEVAADNQLEQLPADKAIWLLGAGNKFAPLVLAALKPWGATFDARGLHTVDETFAPENRSFVVGVRHPGNPASVVILVSAPSAAASAALARKLPHYGKYSWLVFAGDDATNEGKGEWPTGDTPLSRNLGAAGTAIKLPLRKALAELGPPSDAAPSKTATD